MGESLWIVEMRTRSADYNRRAWEFLDCRRSWDRSIITKDGRSVSAYDNENDWRKYAWACKLAQKYWRLSDYPWLPVEPDPPPPERVDHPRRAVDLPAEMELHGWNRSSRPPAWTFLWTWRRR
jgi:hypothetical protein